MSFENSAGLGVYANYGVRNTGGTVGVERSQASVHNMSIDFTGASVNDAFMSPFYLPKGAHVLRYILRVDEVFALTGTSPTVIFGGTTPATNGVVLTKAELEAVGTKVPASAGAGTWATNSATGTTASERVTKTIGGTGSPTVSATTGKGTLVVEYVFKTLV